MNFKKFQKRSKDGKYITYHKIIKFVKRVAEIWHKRKASRH